MTVKDLEWRRKILWETEHNEIERMAKCKYGKSYDDLDLDEQYDCTKSVLYFMFGGKPPSYKKGSNKEKVKVKESTI